MANDKPGLRKTFTTKTRYSGKLHQDKMTDAQARKMIADGKAWLDRLKKSGGTPPKRQPRKPKVPMGKK